MQERYPDSKNPYSTKEGLEFQDFIADELFTLGIIIQNYSSKKYQLTVGENRQGVEIKLDNRCTETGRMSIEIAEKSKASNWEFVPSGIYRRDNTILYIQGNYNLYAIFSKKFLISLHKKDIYEEHESPRNNPTVRAFFLPLPAVEKYAIKVVKKGVSQINIPSTSIITPEYQEEKIDIIQAMSDLLDYKFSQIDYKIDYKFFELEKKMSKNSRGKRFKDTQTPQLFPENEKIININKFKTA